MAAPNGSGQGHHEHHHRRLDHRRHRQCQAAAHLLWADGIGSVRIAHDLLAARIPKGVALSENGAIIAELGRSAGHHRRLQFVTATTQAATGFTHSGIISAHTTIGAVSSGISRARPAARRHRSGGHRQRNRHRARDGERPA